MPALNDYLVIHYMLKKLNIDLKLSSIISKQSGEKALPIIKKIVNFLEEKRNILKTTEDSRVKYQLMLKTFTNSNTVYQEAEEERKQTMAEKDKEQPVY